jgi:O-antigen/teichoic acid export membrane protein
MEGMNRKIAVGVTWNLVNLLCARGANTIFILVLAGILAPEAFGLVAMAAVVFELANSLINSGLGTALIRSSTVSDIDLSTVFFSNFLLSGMAYTTLYIGAPFVADFYGQPELTNLIQVMGFVVFFNAAKVVQIAVFSRAMDFKTLMKAEALGALLSGCFAVIAAWNGLGVWSLAVQTLSAASVSALVLWLCSTWRPCLAFSKESFVRLFRFGGNLLVDGLLSVLFQNSYILVIGKFFSAEVTGLYFLAKKISNLISQQLTAAVQQATFPALSTLKGNKSGLKYKYQKIIQIMMFSIVPIMGLIAVLAPAFFQFLFEERWSGAVIYLQLLCVVGAIHPLHALNINLLNVLGRSDLVLRIGVVKKTLNLTLLFLAIPYGVVGIAIGQIVGSLVSLVPNTYYTARLIDYSLLEQLNDVLKPVISTLVACAGAWWTVQSVMPWNPVSMVFSSLAGILIYLLMSMFLHDGGCEMAFVGVKRIVLSKTLRIEFRKK